VFEKEGGQAQFSKSQQVCGSGGQNDENHSLPKHSWFGLQGEIDIVPQYVKQSLFGVPTVGFRSTGLNTLRKAVQQEPTTESSIVDRRITLVGH
jgi:hypothetical protein